MQDKGPSLPEVGKISKVIDALRDYAVENARTSWEEHQTDTYRAPCVAAWGAFAWFELLRDWELVEFLISDTGRSKVLLKSLQSCLQWYGQTEIDEILGRMRIMSIVN